MQGASWVLRLLALPRPVKQGMQVGCDFMLLLLALYLAYVLRMEAFSLREPVHFAVAAPTGAAVGVLAFERLGLYRALVRYGGQAHWPAIFVGLLAAASTLSLLGWVQELFVPRSVPALMIVVALPLVGGVRVLAQRLLQQQVQNRTPVAIYGAGSAGSELALALQAGMEFRPLFFVDDNTALHRSSVQGLRVHPPQQLEKLVADYEISRVFMALPGVSSQRKREILEKLVALPVPVLTVPSVAELISGKLSISALREVSVADLLGREPVPPLAQWFDADISNKVVMVTGAGGSIGSELCRLALSRAPRLLVLYELSELALYTIESELRQLGATAGHATRIEAVLGSVQDEATLRRVMQAHAVDTVYHAAAYKHVPLVEANLGQGVLNNVFGTLAAAQSAIATGVSTFVLVSTDKAVRPTSVMGASKRTAELVCQALAASQTRVRFSMVRFGNVLDSSGSVVPLFRAQIKAGGPVTVTHPEVIRYFMTIREAAELVIQAGAMARGGEVFVLDMGEPVRIAELALRMIQLSGLQARTAQNPEGDIEIRYTGLRPGEKLYEELLVGGEVTETGHPRICGCRESYVPIDALRPQLQALRQACQGEQTTAIRELLRALPLQYSGG